MAAELGQRLVLDRKRGGAAVIGFDGLEVLRRRWLCLCQGKHTRGCKQDCRRNDECDAFLTMWSDHWPPSSARRASSRPGQSNLGLKRHSLGLWRQNAGRLAAIQNCL